MAGPGTLFLDEVGEIPPANQVDFLRVLEEKSFRRMGGERDISFQARIVAATNRPLVQMVQEGAFRADLFYRLNVVPVCLPPLRSRKEDIPLLTEHVFSLFRHRYHRHDLTLREEVLEAFGGRKAPWKLALWFTSNNGGLPGSARPVDLLASDPDAVVQAARGDAEGSAA